jgi:uncharacterized membrane protein YkvA (DUF1232 family)
MTPDAEQGDTDYNPTTKYCQGQFCRRLARGFGVSQINTMAFTSAAFWRRNDSDDDTLRRSFWRKTKRVAAQIPFAEDLFAAYYCAFDRSTPLQVKATLVGAIAYFVLPIDAIPDVMPVLGFTDDAAVLAMAIKLVAGSIRPEHRAAARSRLDKL